MQVDLKMKWTMEFTPEEFGLISRALRGNLKEQDEEGAMTLQREMMEQKVKCFDHYAKEMDKLRKNLGAGTEDSK